MKYYAIEVENPRGERFLERRKFRTRFMANIELADRMENACQTARSGEGYGDTPPPIGDDSICDRCEIAKRIRGNEEVKE